jgi:hypothetical protein
VLSEKDRGGQATRSGIVSQPQCDQQGEQEHNQEKNERGRPKQSVQSPSRRRRRVAHAWWDERGITRVRADPFPDRPRCVSESRRGHVFGEFYASRARATSTSHVRSRARRLRSSASANAALRGRFPPRASRVPAGAQSLSSSGAVGGSPTARKPAGLASPTTNDSRSPDSRRRRTVKPHGRSRWRQRECPRFLRRQSRRARTHR